LTPLPSHRRRSPLTARFAMTTKKKVTSRITIRDYNVGMMMQLVAVGIVYVMMGDRVSMSIFFGIFLSIWTIGLVLLKRSQCA
jgi:hypothetical protein